VTTLVFRQDLWHQKTIECQDNVWRCLRERDPMFSRLLTDRRTDRQTDTWLQHIETDCQGSCSMDNWSIGKRFPGRHVTGVHRQTAKKKQEVADG